MICNKLCKNAFLLLTIPVAFLMAGQFGLFCEGLHESLITSTAIFSTTFASFIAGISKVYTILFLENIS
jgi:hypothetical protein